ncbi:MAG: class I SAM-dependent methyltransferase [Promethearchaeota archaeon]
MLLCLHNFINKEINEISTKLNDNINPKHYIMDYHQFFLDNIRENSVVLDIGCGLGILTHEIAKKAKKVVGIDIKKRAINRAKLKFNRENIEYIVGDATNYDFDQKFDHVILSNVLEHIENRKTFLKKIKSLSDYFLIRVPMIDRSWLTLFKKKIGVEYRLDPTHQIEYTLETFQKEIEGAGLKIISYKIKFGEIWALVTS